MVKVGNQINVDVQKLQEWDVELGPTLELGHLAQSRAVTPHKNPSVATLLSKLWPGVEIEGKQPGTGPRISDWSAILSRKQERYANNDGYAEAVIYQWLMQIMIHGFKPLSSERILLKEFK